MRSWRYEVRNNEHCQGWAILHLDSGGFFGVCSDYGDYAYLWSGHGREDFRTFVCELTHDPDYAATKLTYGRSDSREFNREETVQRIREEICRERRSGTLTKGEAIDEWDEVEYLADGEMSFDEWCGRTGLEDAHEFYNTKTNHQAMAFCKEVLPRLVEVIRKELTDEAAATPTT